MDIAETQTHRGDEGRHSQGTGLESELGWSLHRISVAYRRTASLAVADVPGGPRGYQVLVAVDEGPPASQLALSRRLVIDKTAMTYLIDELEGAGLVTRKPDPSDRRVRHVVATAAGRERLLHTRHALRATENDLLATLSPPDATVLRELLTRVARTAEPAVPCATSDEVVEPDTSA